MGAVVSKATTYNIALHLNATEHCQRNGPQLLLCLPRPDYFVHTRDKLLHTKKLKVLEEKR